MSKAAFFAGILSLTTLTVAGCGDDTTTDEPMMVTPADAGPAPAPPPVVERVTRHTVVVGRDEDIVARRAGLAVRRSYGVRAGASGLKTSSTSPFIPSSGSFFADPRGNATIRIDLRRGLGGQAAAVAGGGVASSDDAVATATLEDEHTIVASLKGKRGNAYITAYDADGSATAKVMILAATPAAGVVVVEDDESASESDSAEPSRLGYGDYDIGVATLATDFNGRSSPQLISALYTPAAPGHRVGTMTFTPAQYANFVKQARAQIPTGPIGAVYLPNKDLLLLPVNGDISAATDSSGQSVDISAAVTQADFQKYVDFGGTLASSALRDQSDVADGALAYAAPTGLGATAPVHAGFVLASGRKIKVGDPDHDKLQDQAVSQLVAYPQLGEPLGEALTCQTSSSAGPVDWRSLYSTAETSFGGTFTWKAGKTDIFLGLKPHFRVGGQIGIQGAFKGSCEKELFQVPLAEWGVPLLGNVSLNVPVKLEFSVDVTGSLTFMTPRFELGSVADVTKPGQLGFEYTTDGGFKTDTDVSYQFPQPRTLQGVAGSAQGTAQVKVEAGIAAGLSLDATVKLWFLKASVSADIGDVLFGFEDTATLTVKPAQGTFDAQNKFELGIFTTIAPTIHIDLPYFKASFNLFDLKVPDFVISGDKDFQTSTSSLVPLETPMTAVATDGTTVNYVQTPSGIEIQNLGTIVSAEINSYLIATNTWTDTGLTAGIDGARLNLTGTNLSTLVKNSQIARYGSLYLANYQVLLTMSGGKTVAIPVAIL